MTKKAVAVLLLICVCFSAFSLDMKNAQPYSDDEFPKWSLDLRRGEIIFFGSLPIAYALTNLVSSNIFNSNMTFWENMAISAGVSAGIALLDYFLGLGSGK
jgi:hypothetical protein